MTKSNSSGISQFQVQSENWSGCIPIELSLAPTSLSSPNMPCSIHVLVSRQTFLHVGLQEAVLRLYKFAPVSFSSCIKRQEPSDDDDNENNNSNTHIQQEQQYPVCWFQDEDSHFALRWHLFVGVLWDLKDSSSKTLPWKIQLHFTNYPSSQILPFDKLETVQQTYMNSLKQALFLQHNSNKVAMNLSKQTHGQLWDAIVTQNFQIHHQVHLPTATSLLPVRILVDCNTPPIQRPCRIQEDVMLPTLGSVLAEWCPNLFCIQENGAVKPKQPSDTSWIIQGISSIDLSTTLVDLWKSLCSPDHFLYICVSTTTTKT
jgi:autophagy-related protein 5